MSERLEIRFKTHIPIGDSKTRVNSLSFLDSGADGVQSDIGVSFDPRTSLEWDEWLSDANEGPVPDEIFVPMHNIEYAFLFSEEESSDCHIGED